MFFFFLLLVLCLSSSPSCTGKERITFEDVVTLADYVMKGGEEAASEMSDFLDGMGPCEAMRLINTPLPLSLDGKTPLSMKEFGETWYFDAKLDYLRKGLVDQ